MPKSWVYPYIEQSPPEQTSTLKITFEDQDCLIVAQSIYKQTQHPVCVLNMANQFNVGGDYLSKRGQEESIILRTDLLDSLRMIDGVKPGNASNPYRYDFNKAPGFSEEQRKGFGEFTTIYSPSIRVFSLDENATSEKDLFTINVLTSAAYNLTQTQEPLSPPVYMAGTIFKIMNQLRTAKEHKQRHLVLGAFGCGTFQASPETIAQIYHAAIHEFEFKGCFDSIVFAIKPDHPEKPNKNLSAFIIAFSVPPKRIYDLMSAEGVFSIDHQLLNVMRQPFSIIETTEQFHFLASRIINDQLSYLNHLPQNNNRYIFLKRISTLLDSTPHAARFIIEAALANPECKACISSFTLFNGVKYPFVTQLETLLEQHALLIPGLNPTQTELAEEFIPGYIQRNMTQLIENSVDDEDKALVSYLLYLAIFKSDKMLNAEIDSRLTTAGSLVVRMFFLALHEICSGASQHKIITSIADRRFQSDQSISYEVWSEQIAQHLSEYTAMKLDTFLLINYPQFYDKDKFESMSQLKSMVI